MSFAHLRDHSSDDESREQEDIYKPPTNRRNIRKILGYGLLVFLIPGWLVALEIYRHPVVIDLTGLPSSHPFPPQVFERVKRVFEPDERYTGPSNQTHHNWDHLVAGKLEITYFIILLTVCTISSILVQ